MSKEMIYDLIKYHSSNCEDILSLCNTLYFLLGGVKFGHERESTRYATKDRHPQGDDDAANTASITCIRCRQGINNFCLLDQDLPQTSIEYPKIVDCFVDCPFCFWHFIRPQCWANDGERQLVIECRVNLAERCCSDDDNVIEAWMNPNMKGIMFRAGCIPFPKQFWASYSRWVRASCCIH